MLQFPEPIFQGTFCQLSTAPNPFPILGLPRSTGAEPFFREGGGGGRLEMRRKKRRSQRRKRKERTRRIMNKKEDRR